MWFWVVIILCYLAMFVWSFWPSIRLLFIDTGQLLQQKSAALVARARHRLRASRVRLKQAYTHWRRDRRHRLAHFQVP